MLTQVDMIAYFENYLATGTEWHPHAIPMSLNDRAPAGRASDRCKTRRTCREELCNG